MFTKRVEPSTPHVYTLLHDAEYCTYNEQKRVSYFGLMQEAVFERLRYEHHNANDGAGPVIGDISYPSGDASDGCL
jgi:hypothetical protein